MNRCKWFLQRLAFIWHSSSLRSELHTLRSSISHIYFCFGLVLFLLYLFVHINKGPRLTRIQRELLNSVAAQVQTDLQAEAKIWFNPKGITDLCRCLQLLPTMCVCDLLTRFFLALKSSSNLVLRRQVVYTNRYLLFGAFLTRFVHLIQENANWTTLNCNFHNH